ncbi:MAG: hypothetical protein A2W21_08935 [Betaproteobacteria bacterium RBG_16_66_20]|nr:MAG: hypothetical protein A2W21_08935 [Betaproteobacteria bacterium RBG_16_66_20]
MKEMNSKPNANLDFIFSRLDEVQMRSSERAKAKSQLARADAVADALFAIGRRLQTLLKVLVLRPIRRLTASFG